MFILYSNRKNTANLLCNHVLPMSYIMTWFCFALWTSPLLAFPIIHMLSANGRGRANTKAEDHISLPVHRFLFLDGIFFLNLIFFNLTYSIVYHRVKQTVFQTEKKWKWEEGVLNSFFYPGRVEQFKVLSYHHNVNFPPSAFWHLALFPHAKELYRVICLIRIFVPEMWKENKCT